MPPVNGYRHAVPVRGELVAISGQIALDADGELVGPGDPVAQAQQVFRNIAKALASQGLTFADVVKIGFYVTDTDQLPALREARDAHVDTANPPASTAVQVAGLIRPDLLVEVDALAVRQA
nr:RidA family protein [Streptomyces coryli]